MALFTRWNHKGRGQRLSLTPKLPDTGITTLLYEQEQEIEITGQYAARTILAKWKITIPNAGLINTKEFMIWLDTFVSGMGKVTQGVSGWCILQPEWSEDDVIWNQNGMPQGFWNNANFTGWSDGIGLNVQQASLDDPTETTAYIQNVVYNQQAGETGVIKNIKVVHLLFLPYGAIVERLI